MLPVVVFPLTIEKMKVISGGVDSTKTEINCSYTIETSIGNVTMYGEIVDNDVNEKATGPSFWNANKFRELSDEEQKLVKETVHSQLRQLLQ
jgi:hypothetical protein